MSKKEETEILPFNNLCQLNINKFPANKLKTGQPSQTRKNQQNMSNLRSPESER